MQRQQQHLLLRQWLPLLLLLLLHLHLDAAVALARLQALLLLLPRLSPRRKAFLQSWRLQC